MTADNFRPLSDKHRERIKAIQAAHGLTRAADFLGRSKQTLDRAVGGLPMHPWTLLKIEEAIAERDAAGKTP